MLELKKATKVASGISQPGAQLWFIGELISILQPWLNTQAAQPLRTLIRDAATQAAANL